MASKLVYYGNVISRCKHLVDANVIKEPGWLRACLAFPPLTPPKSPKIPDWESESLTMTHRKGPFFVTDGHRFDPKKPTEMPKDKQSFREDQPPVIYFSSDQHRRQYYQNNPSYVICLLPEVNKGKPTECRRELKKTGTHVFTNVMNTKLLQIGDCSTVNLVKMVKYELHKDKL